MSLKTFLLKVLHIMNLPEDARWVRNTNTWVSTDWTEADAEVPGGKAHLWEESWDDDDTSEDFSAQLRYDARSTGP